MKYVGSLIGSIEKLFGEEGKSLALSNRTFNYEYNGHIYQLDYDNEGEIITPATVTVYEETFYIFH